MLTEAQDERKAFEQQERMRQHVREYAKAKARHEVSGQRDSKILDGAARTDFERLLESCEKDAHEIACEAGEEASSKVSRTELSVPAYEVAYIEAYSDALPALVATALAPRQCPQSAA